MGRSSKIFVLAIAGAVALAAPCAGLRAADLGPPNIVVIMADDLSMDVLDALLAAGLMPNLQTRLIDAGVSFENAFVTDSNCCPSRVTFLRGQYAHNHGVLSNSDGIASPGWFPRGGNPGRNGSTIATWLRGGSYTTGHIGKYLNGYGIGAPPGVADPRTYIPPGYDDWQGLIDPTTYRVYDYEMNDNGTVVAYGGAEADYQTDVLAGRAAQFIDARAQAGESFFLVITPLAPHVELIPTANGELNRNPAFNLTIRPAPRHEVFINADPGDGEVPSLVQKPSFNEADMSDKPSCPQTGPPGELVTEPFCIGDHDVLDEADVANAEAQYKTMSAAMLAFDELIGTVLDALTANGILDQTVVVFTSDNGWHHGEHRFNGKHVPYEESIRVPLVISGPGVAAGATASQIALNNDLAPTLAELGGVTPPYDLDGMSLMPILTDPSRDDWPRKRFLVEHWFAPSRSRYLNPSFSAVRWLSGGRDILYVAWRSDENDRQLVTDRRFYQISNDPYQLNGLILSAGAAQGLDQLVSHLRQCSGQACRNLESF